uniref:Dynein heavy chain n=1 Tax=Meloidogyne incognita TaxID=6306 RepID=A0A914LMZ7_MELIC
MFQLQVEQKDFLYQKDLLPKLRVLILDSPDEKELKSICAANLRPFFDSKISKGGPNNSSSKIEMIVSAMATTFIKLTKIFTPNEHFHYVFTTGDLSCWVCSLQRYDLDEADTDQLYQCLYFEALRIFSDRLISTEHRLQLQTILNEHFPLRERSLIYAPMTGILTKENKKCGGKSMQLITKSDYSSQLQRAINRLKADHEEAISLPISDIFMEIALTSSGGSVLLAGQSGIGSRAAIEIMSQMHQMKLCNLRVSSSYSLRQFNQDLRDAIQMACVDGEQVLLVIEDYQLLDESFLQHINSLIASGNVPGLYNSQQEVDSLLSRLRDSAMEEGFGGGGSTTGNLHDYFAFKIQQNVHVAMIMNTRHQKFASRILSNPSLYKRCNIIWQPNLSPETLKQIAELSLMQKKDDSDKNAQPPANWLLQSFVQLFQLAPSESQSPERFSIFVENFHQLLSSKRATIERRVNSLRGGVTKLTETRTAVAKLQKRAAKKSKQLAEKQAEADAALAEITKSMTSANEQKADMEGLKSATEAENLKIEEQKKLIDQQLSELSFLLARDPHVEPLLKEAREAVGSIKSESLSEIRSLRAPPEAIRDILQAVLLFMGILDVSWEAMRKFLAKSGVKEEIINFDARRISPDTAKRVSALVKSKATSFDPKNAKRASAAAAPLAAWVSANLQYALIVEKIAPLEQKKETLERNLNAAEKQMASLSKGLKTVDKRVEGLKSNFEVYMKEATEIKIGLEREQATLVVASTLVERLGDEYTRWQQQSKQLETELATIENCCLLGAAFLTFLGPSTEEVRTRTMQNWQSQFPQLPEGFDILRFLSTESEQLNWKQAGIPSNRLALENGAIIFRSKQTPFVIDPSGTIASFLFNYFKEIKKAEGGAQLLVASQSDLMTQASFF